MKKNVIIASISVIVIIGAGLFFASQQDDTNVEFTTQSFVGATDDIARQSWKSCCDGTTLIITNSDGLESPGMENHSGCRGEEQIPQCNRGGTAADTNLGFLEGGEQEIDTSNVSEKFACVSKAAMVDGKCRITGEDENGWAISEDFDLSAKYCLDLYNSNTKCNEDS